MEVWDLYDSKRNKTGKTHVRGVPLPEELYHLVVHVWVENDNGDVLLSKRHPHKSYGGLWECTGGSVLTGETSLQGALRETQEEIGLTLDAKIGKLLYSQLRQTHHLDVWLFRSNATIEDLTFQEDEVIDAKWVNEDTYNSMLKEKMIVPTLHHFYQLKESTI
ncbi:NUDIX domain-containing protein [Ornithinibacillus sp. L9]|uniref:NUDIX domain-containing protein n=1 Tax=Ornithinibacillus caprae TaxID=2678566 RepID=A0A6N8FIQ1_9BACI|nr:NUDIX domain-containing protein [Ornithinibacillus caprae]MUK89345.1 NUDIX domain-containing protein [Ornithinibacillus caprae]